MGGIVECVPNFSEGRRPEVLKALIEAVAGVPGVVLLDSGMDPDHNRAVLTFCGPAQAVSEAAFRATACATEHIDLRTHDGVHPRIGATDVVPFVPVGGTPMQACVELAEAFGERVARELEIPVYLYEEAARAPERRNLAFFRKGGLTALADAMGSDPLRAPDLGPARLHPSAGALVTGARFFLIAYNVELATGDLALARKIAREVRESSGGLPAVKALGLPLARRGTVQVSMNLTDYRKTSMAAAFERVRVLAARAGVEVARSELIGLVPQEALEGTARDALRLEGFGRDRILEERIERAVTGTRRMHLFLRDLASTAPSPGGGAAGALAGALAAATAEKVVNLRAARADEDTEATGRALAEAAEALHAARWELVDLIDRDAAAYRGYVEVTRLPKTTDAERASRKAAVQAALLRAAEVPLDIIAQVGEVLGALEALLPHLAKHLLSDAAAAAALATAAADAARAMVRVNAAGLNDRTRAEQLRREASAACADAHRRADSIDERFTDAIAP
jgi:glutamate formiminotransferase